MTFGCPATKVAPEAGSSMAKTESVAGLEMSALLVVNLNFEGVQAPATRGLPAASRAAPTVKVTVVEAPYLEWLSVTVRPSALQTVLQPPTSGWEIGRA